MGQKQRLLLLEDVETLGRSGQVVEVKKGFARNFLIPQAKATAATVHALRMQVKLQEERSIKAEHDKTESEALAKVIEEKGSITLEVKVDPEGKLYGSVTTQDICEKLAEDGITLDRKHIKLAKSIKDLGTFDIPITLKEEVMTKIILQVNPEGGPLPVTEAVKEETAEEKPAE